MTKSPLKAAAVMAALFASAPALAVWSPRNLFRPKTESQSTAPRTETKVVEPLAPKVDLNAGKFIGEVAASGERSAMFDKVDAALQRGEVFIAPPGSNKKFKALWARDVAVTEEFGRSYLAQGAKLSDFTTKNGQLFARMVRIEERVLGGVVTAQHNVLASAIGHIVK